MSHAANTKQLKLHGAVEGGAKDSKWQGQMEATPPKVRGLSRPDSTTAVPVAKGEPSTMSVNMTRHNLGQVMVGKKIHFKGHGVIRSHHHDEYGHKAHLDVHHLEVNMPKYDNGIPLEKNEGVKK